MARRQLTLTDKQMTDLTSRVIKAISDTQKIGEPRAKNSKVIEIDTPAWNQIDPKTARLRTHADLRREYIVARLDSLPQFLKTLPNAFDDLTCDFGIEAYRRMLQDNEVSAAFKVLILAITAQGATVDPCVDPDDKNHAKAKQYAEFFDRQIKNLSKPFSETLEEMLDALSEGSSITEVMTDLIEDGEDKGLIGIKSLSKKPLENSRFLIDAYNTVAGIMPIRIGTHMPYRTQIPLNMDGKTTDAEWVLRRDKFVIFTYEPQSNDPRGRSLLRSAYAAWYAKECVLKAWLQFVGLSADPILAVTAGEEAGDICVQDPETGEEITYKATEYLSMLIRDAKNGSRIALPSGAKMDTVATANVGVAFEKFIDWCDKAILRAILNQHLATGEGEHQARSAAEVHKDTLSLQIVRIKNRLCDRIREDLFKPLMIRNFGEESAVLTPVLNLGDGDGFPPKTSEIMEFLRVAPEDAIDWAMIKQKYKLPIKSDYEPKPAQAIPSALLQNNLGQKDKSTELSNEPQDATVTTTKGGENVV